MKFSSPALIILASIIASKEEYTVSACPFATLFGESTDNNNNSGQKNGANKNERKINSHSGTSTTTTQFLRPSSSSSENRNLQETTCSIHLQTPPVSLGQLTQTGNNVYDAFAREVYKELRRQALFTRVSPGFVADVTPQGLVRLAFHECIPFGQLGPGLGGSNGSIQRELDLIPNSRLEGPYSFLEALIGDGTDFPGITLADAPHIAAAVAVQAYGGPAYSINFGRPVDFTDEDTCNEDTAFSCWPPPVPPPMAGVDHAQLLLGFYENAGFSDPVRALVASSGAHTLGGVRFPGFSFDFTSDSYTFDNGYFTLITDFWDVIGTPEASDFFTNLPHSPNGCPVALLPSDVVLGDPTNVEMRALVEEYALDQSKWFEDFSGFMQECSLRGVQDPDALVDPAIY